VPIRAHKPTSPGRRGGATADFSGLAKKRPERSLTERLPEKAGRNAHGRITARSRGGGHRRKYRRIDWRRDKDGVPGRVVSIEYDPNRSARIALVQYADGERRYILAPNGLAVGRAVMNGPEAEPEVGNCMPLSRMPLGTPVHNVELKPGRGGQLARSAGVAARLMAREGDYAHVLLPSGEVRMVHVSCRATVGQVGNLDHSSVDLGKGGRSRWLGVRPRTRASVKNPVDHPMGGGEGRSKGHRPEGPTGVPAKGGKTRSPRAVSGPFIIRGRKRGRKRKKG
jgi:large subunit ribosomal protein L2